MSDFFGEFDGRAEVEKAIMEFFHGIHFHEPALGAGTIVGWTGNEVFSGGFFLEAVQHAGLGDDDDVFGFRIAAEVDHFLGGTDFVGEDADGVGALRMGDDDGIGVFLLDGIDAIAGELDVDVTSALPEIHFTAGFFHDPGAEVLVRDEEDGPIFGSGLDDADGIA